MQQSGLSGDDRVKVHEALRYLNKVCNWAENFKEHKKLSADHSVHFAKTSATPLKPADSYAQLKQLRSELDSALTHMNQRLDNLSEKSTHCGSSQKARKLH